MIHYAIWYGGTWNGGLSMKLDCHSQKEKLAVIEEKERGRGREKQSLDTIHLLYQLYMKIKKASLLTHT